MRLVLLLVVSVCTAESRSADYFRGLTLICADNQRNPFLIFACGMARYLSPNQAPVLNTSVLTVLENTPPGSIITSVTIVDYDGPRPPNVTVLTGPLVAHPVTMTSKLGVFSCDLELTQELDRENRERHVVRFKLTDGTSVTFARIDLRVTDVNEKPVFEKSKYTTTLPNSAEIYCLVLKVKAVDPEARMLTYILRSNDAFVFGHFQVDPTTGHIYLRSTLEAVTSRSTHAFTIIATDTEGLTDTTVVEVTVVPDIPVTVPPNHGRVPPLLLNNTEFEEVLYFNSGEEITLPCQAAADDVFPPSYTWEKDGAVLSIDGHLTRDQDSGNLIISNSSASDEGDYRCFAANTFGRSMGTLYTLKERFLGTFTTVPRAEVMAALGEFLRVTCFFPVFDAETRTIFWQYRDSPTEEFQDFNYSASVVPNIGDSLVFRAVDKLNLPDGRVLRCGISVGDGLVAYSSEIPIRTIEVPPSHPDIRLVYTSEPVETAVAGESVTFNCIFYGKPLPDQTWTGPNMTNQSHAERLWNTQYYIPSVTTDDAGQYNCTATGAQNISETTRFILVVDEKPWFQYGPEDVETSGGSVRFSCRAEGTPTPVTSFFINGEPLNDVLIPSTREGRASVEQPSGDLVISNVKDKDTMVVGCKASNRHGSAYQEGRLIYKNSI